MLTLPPLRRFPFFGGVCNSGGGKFALPSLSVVKSGSTWATALRAGLAACAGGGAGGGDLCNGAAATSAGPATVTCMRFNQTRSNVKGKNVAMGTVTTSLASEHDKTSHIFCHCMTHKGVDDHVLTCDSHAMTGTSTQESAHSIALHGQDGTPG